jgi:hypothetical protein
MVSFLRRKPCLLPQRRSFSHSQTEVTRLNPANSSASIYSAGRSNWGMASLFGENIGLAGI